MGKSHSELHEENPFLHVHDDLYHIVHAPYHINKLGCVYIYSSLRVQALESQTEKQAVNEVSICVVGFLTVLTTD